MWVTGVRVNKAILTVTPICLVLLDRVYLDKGHNSYQLDSLGSSKLDTLGPFGSIPSQMLKCPNSTSPLGKFGQKLQNGPKFWTNPAIFKSSMI